MNDDILTPDEFFSLIEHGYNANEPRDIYMAREAYKRLVCAFTSVFQELTAEKSLHTATQACLEARVREVETLTKELYQWRTAGVTEELLRRHDGSIKVGRGCVLVREEDWVALTAKEPS